jgi:uncharacterized membrane protein
VRRPAGTLAAAACVPLLVLLAGCARSLPRAGAAPSASAAAEARVPELEAEIRALRSELGRLRAENGELHTLIERLEALDLDRERKRRETR